MYHDTQFSSIVSALLQSFCGIALPNAPENPLIKLMHRPRPLFNGLAEFHETHRRISIVSSCCWQVLWQVPAHARTFQTCKGTIKSLRSRMILKSAKCRAMLKKDPCRFTVVHFSRNSFQGNNLMYGYACTASLSRSFISNGNLCKYNLWLRYRRKS